MASPRFIFVDNLLIMRVSEEEENEKEGLGGIRKKLGVEERRKNMKELTRKRRKRKR